MSNNHAHFSRSVNSSMNRKNRHLSGLIKYAVFTYTRHCLLRINTMATAYEEKCIKRAILPSGKLIKQNLNAAHLWVRSNMSTSPLVFSPVLNISSVKSKQLYSRERLLYISVVLKYPACVFIFTCPRCLIVYHFKLWLSCYLCRGLPKWSIFYQCNPPLYTTVRNTQHFITAQVLGLQSYVPCRGAL